MTFVLDQVGFTYPANPDDPDSEPKEVLRDVSVSIPAGTRMALFGKSGVGKSTLVSLLGLLTGTKKFRGKISYTDSRNTTHHYETLSQDAAEQLRGTEFGFALQSSYLLPHFTVAENLGIPLGVNGYSDAERDDLARKFLDLAGLFTKADRLPSTLSGGEQQRVGVLRALIHQPTVVFADEPFSALDDDNKYKILDLLVRWQEEGLENGRPSDKPDAKRTLFLVCHDPQVAEKYDAEILTLRNNFQFEFVPLSATRHDSVQPESVS